MEKLRVRRQRISPFIHKANFNFVPLISFNTAYRFTRRVVFVSDYTAVNAYSGFNIRSFIRKTHGSRRKRHSVIFRIFFAYFKLKIANAWHPIDVFYYRCGRCWRRIWQFGRYSKRVGASNTWCVLESCHVVVERDFLSRVSINFSYNNWSARVVRISNFYAELNWATSYVMFSIHVVRFYR